MSRTAGLLIIIGSLLFLVGAAIAVPRVFTVPDRQERLRLLEAQPRRWRVGQPFYALGALVATLGVAWLAAVPPGSASLGTSAALVAVGGLAWTRSVYLRARHPRDFALGHLPGRPFTAYVWCTLAALLLLGAGLLLGGWPRWTGWMTIGATVLFVAGYVRTGDIPPFVFYLLLAVVGVAVL